MYEKNVLNINVIVSLNDCIPAIKGSPLLTKLFLLLYCYNNLLQSKRYVN